MIRDVKEREKSLTFTIAPHKSSKSAEITVQREAVDRFRSFSKSHEFITLAEICLF